MVIFVYGSLKRGFMNHHVMERAAGKFLGTAVTTDDYDMVDLGAFPGVVSPGNFQIKGEVFLVDNHEIIDRLEGHPNFYRRERVIVQGIEKEPFDKAEWDVWMYIYQGFGRHIFPEDSPRILVENETKTWQE